MVKPAPAPLVLQFVERIFAVRPVAIKLGERQDFLVERGDQHAVFIDLALRPDLDKAERELTGVIAPGDGQAFLQPAAQDDRLALAAPALQPQRIGLFLASPGLAAVQSSLENVFLISFLTLAVRRSLNR